jgi:hypothetical protein
MARGLQKPMFRLVFLLLLGASVFGVAPAYAQGRSMPRGDVQTLDRILPGVSSRYPGTFYDAEGPFPDANGTPHYRLKWMTPEGRIIWLDTDARTGRVTGVQQNYPRAYDYRAPPRYAAPPAGAYSPPGYRGGYGYPRGGYYGVPRGGRVWNGHGGSAGGWGGHNGYGHHGG